MAYYSIFPEKDTTLYSHPSRKEMNSGGDEILELVKERGDTNNILYPSRYVIKFKNEEVTKVMELINTKKNLGSLKFQQQMTRGYINDLPNFNGTSFSASLHIYSVNPTNLTTVQNIKLHAVSQSWDEGTGRYSNLPKTTNGSSWIYKSSLDSGFKWATSSFGVNATGSISSSLITHGGGNWFINGTGDAEYTGFEYSQQFLTGDSLDINVDIAQLISKNYIYHSTTAENGLYKGIKDVFTDDDFYPWALPNNGLIVKLPDGIELNVSHSLGELNYFSVDTHTIYPPKLTFKWDDSITHISQSVLNPKIKISGSLDVSVYRNKEEYNQNDIATIRLHVRDKYPTRTFSTTSNNLNVGYFTTQSFYSVRDAHTEEEIIPFDSNNTKLSSDNNGMFFKMYMQGLQPERYYRFLFKHINDDGVTVYDNDYHFKIVR